MVKVIVDVIVILHRIHEIALHPGENNDGKEEHEEHEDRAV